VAAVTPWDSTSPSSAISRLFTPGGRADLGSEPARAAGSVSNAGGRAKRWDSSSPLSALEGAPSARQRALKTRGGQLAAGVGTLTFRRPLAGEVPGTTQLVDGAALIQRYCQVRFLGARLLRTSP
jgi:hypothetical protein